MLNIKQIEGIHWLEEFKNELHKTPGSMFVDDNDTFAKMWQKYVDINEVLKEHDLPEINLPREMEYPVQYDYMLENVNEDYTRWYKRNYNKFRIMMRETEEMIDDYILLIKGIK